MVVDDADRRCAFVDEIETCILPKDWRRRPDDVSPGAWSCPYSDWLSGLLPCLVEERAEPAGPAEAIAPTDVLLDQPVASEAAPGPAELRGATARADVGLVQTVDAERARDTPAATAAPKARSRGMAPSTIVPLALVAAILVAGTVLASAVIRRWRA
jgi:hypothetical protein